VWKFLQTNQLSFMFGVGTAFPPGPQLGRRRGAKPSLQNSTAPLEKYIGHRLKTSAPYQKTLLYPWCPKASYGPGSHTSIFSNTHLPARKNFWTRFQLSTKSDALSSTNILLSLIIFFQPIVQHFWNFITAI